MHQLAAQLLPTCVGEHEHDVPAAAVEAVAVVAIAIAQTGSGEAQQQLVQLLADDHRRPLVQAALSLCLTRAAPAAAALLLQGLQQGRPGQGLGKLLQLQQLEDLCAFVCSSSSGSNASSVDRLPSVKQLAQEFLDAGLLLSDAVFAQLLNALSRGHPELQPAAAAVATGFVVAGDQRHAADAAAVAPTDVQDLLQLVAALCGSLLLSSSRTEPEDLEGSLASSVSHLTPEAAAAALFAVGLPGAQLQTADDQTTKPVSYLAPLLCLELYRSAKQTGDSLVYDLALVAAAKVAIDTGKWQRGESIVAAAAKAAQASESGKGTRHSHIWVPTLPAAKPAMLQVLVHTEGVDSAAKLLLAAHAEQQQELGSVAPAAGRKGRPAGSNSGHKRMQHAALGALLSVPVVNSFLSAAVYVVTSKLQKHADGEAESAAQAALRVAMELFKRQLVAVSMFAAGSVNMPAATAGAMAMDAETWSSLLQLYGAVGAWQQVANAVAASVLQQLPGVQHSGLQTVLAGAAAALNAAGRPVVAVQLLDGLLAAGCEAISDPFLAQQLCNAAGNEENELVWQELSGRLEGGEEVIFDQLPALASGAASTADKAAVRLSTQHQPMQLKQLIKLIMSS